MSRMEYLTDKEQELRDKIEIEIQNGTYDLAKTTLSRLTDNQKLITRELENQAIPLGYDLDFDSIEVGDKFREESSTTDIDGIYYVHEVLYIAKEVDSSGNRTLFAKVSYENDFWYGTMDEDYFK
ncbi:hypothetical protein [Bacillus phage Hakuna]|uniref:Uncharacterized protein n=2 Tax=Wphvirus TaxID=1922327 RepID=A0A024B168_9CAUD|nr:hypothetical protein FP72_gp119 [Bacillus phage Hakuna]YP_009279292.1 hypothetical protein BIZ89_gp125 [Bacillus phage Kida]YP_009285069.1 hypothetical protein BIZ88_gp127 [Bacillus phage DirtyBetty]YP_009287002.1 hypothetical protein BI006_gp126 [Bacillus phage Nemo]ASR78770.1 hypothetical protein BUBS_127 [Bacillus phage Bubs]ASR79222.1 hypothetical protein ZAINNY_127 [Bacillus phage Zainny]QDH49398.1 hypothetical protein PHIREBALL_124 [Bacillus phage Phireball]QDH50105.1 hypothetical p